MGAGPRRLIDCGLVDRLRERGYDVEVSYAEPETSFLAEIGTAFELQRQVALRVTHALKRGDFPLILSGNCNIAAIGALAAIGDRQPSVVWFDGHADFCTPDTAELPFLDGMGLAMATGRCWMPLTRAVPGFQPVSEAQAILVGAHEIEQQEWIDLQASAITHVTVETIRQDTAEVALVHALSSLKASTQATYLHIDLDVHEPSLAPANHLAPEGGLTPGEVREAVRAVARTLPVRVASLTAYDPACDADGAMLEVALNLATTLVDAIATVDA
jgi:arginase